MIGRNGQRWELYPYKVRYTNSLNPDESNITRWATPSRKWWDELRELHEHIEIHEFIEVEINEAMENRFREIEYMPEDYFESYSHYVETGEILDVELPINHPFNFIKLRQEQVAQDEYLLELDFRQTLSEMEMSINDL